MSILTAREKGASTQSGKGCGLSVSLPELTGPVFRSKEPRSLEKQFMFVQHMR